MKKFDMNEMQRRAGMVKSSSLGSPTPQVEQTTNTIYDRLSGQMAKTPNLGLLGGWKAKAHERSLGLDTVNKVNEEKFKLVGELSVTALRNEVQLISEQMRIEFNQQYAALAERSAVSEIMALRKFEAVCETARDLLLEDRAGALGLITERYESGYLSEEDSVHDKKISQ